jgi:hypothetical protein
MVILDGELVEGTRVCGGELYLLSLRSHGQWQRESMLGFTAAVTTQLKPGMLLGGEASYLRKYEGVDLKTPASQAVAFRRNFFLRVSKSLAIPRGHGACGWQARHRGSKRTRPHQIHSPAGAAWRRI